MEVDVLEGFKINLLALAFQIHHLTAHQARGPRHQRQLSHHLEQPFGGNPRTAQRHHLKGTGQQCVTGKDRNSFAVDLVVCGASTPQVVVIHGRKVVMDQRHGVNHLQRHCRWHGLGSIPTRQLAGGQAEDWPQTLSSCQQ